MFQAKQEKFWQDLVTKVTIALIYAFLYSIALNFFGNRDIFMQAD